MFYEQNNKAYSFPMFEICVGINYYGQAVQ